MSWCIAGEENKFLFHISPCEEWLRKCNYSKYEYNTKKDSCESFFVFFYYTEDLITRLCVCGAYGLGSLPESSVWTSAFFFFLETKSLR